MVYWSDPTWPDPPDASALVAVICLRCFRVARCDRLDFASIWPLVLPSQQPDDASQSAAWSKVRVGQDCNELLVRENQGRATTGKGSSEPHSMPARELVYANRLDCEHSESGEKWFQ